MLNRVALSKLFYKYYNTFIIISEPFLTIGLVEFK